MTNLTNVIVAAILIVSMIITYVVVPWIKSKTTVQQRDDMLKWVEIGVAAAQQLYYNLDGAKRKEYVRKFLADKGYNINTKEIDSAIEAAVLRLHKELSV